MLWIWWKISLFLFLLDPNIEFTNLESIRIWFDVDEDEQVGICAWRKWRQWGQSDRVGGWATKHWRFDIVIVAVDTAGFGFGIQYFARTLQDHYGSQPHVASNILNSPWGQPLDDEEVTVQNDRFGSWPEPGPNGREGRREWDYWSRQVRVRSEKIKKRWQVLCGNRSRRSRFGTP